MITFEEMRRIRDAAEEQKWAHFELGLEKAFNHNPARAAELDARVAAAGKEMQEALDAVTDWLTYKKDG